MTRPLPKRVLMVVGGLALLLLLGYWQRGPLLRMGLDFALAGTPLTFAELQGLRLTRTGVQVQQVDFLLPAQGQSLAMFGVELTWRGAGRFGLPQPDALRIDSARLGAAASSGPEAGGEAAEPAPVDVAGLLQLLRHFPLSSIELGALELPGRAAPVSARVTASAGNFAAQLRSAGFSAALTLTQPAVLSAAELQLQVQVDAMLAANLAFSMPATADPAEVAGSGAFAVSGQWEGEPFAATGTLQLPSCTMTSAHPCLLSFAGEATLAAWNSATNPGTGLSGLALSGTGTLGLDAETLQWQLGAASFAGTLAALNAGDVHMGGAFTLSDVELAWDTAAQGSLRLRTDGLTLDTALPWLPPFDLDASLVLAGSRLDLDSKLLLREGTVAGELRVQGHHDLASAAGSAAVTLPRLQLAAGSTLGQRLGQWPYAWDLVLGSVEAGLQLQWQKDTATAQTRVTGMLSGSFADVGGYHGSAWFRGLDLALTAQIDSTQALPLATPPLELTVTEIDVGLPLRDLVLRLQMDAASNSVVIESLTGALLGGTLAMHQQRFDLAASDNLLTLQFDGLRLEQVMALTGYEDIVVDGGLSGTVPLHFNAAGIEVAGGQLSAQQGGGSIRYLGTLGQGDASLALVRQALSNYRFDALDSSIQYTPDGELLLGMQLRGYNPELENGRRVDLNLNLSDNILTLLRSLQAGRNIEDLMEALYQ